MRIWNTSETDWDGYSVDDGFLHDTGNETADGIKTFLLSPIVPAPTTDFQAATKKYVDDNAGGGGVGTANSPAAGEFAKFTSATLIEGRTLSETRSDLGLVIGTNVQAFDADLSAIAALTSAANKLPYATGAQAWALTDLSVFARTLLDDADAGTALTTLGVSAFIQTLLDDASASAARTTLGALGVAQTGATSDQVMFSTTDGGWTHPRMRLDADGKMFFGDGTTNLSAPRDTLNSGIATVDGYQMGLGLETDGDWWLMAYDAGGNRWSGIRLVGAALLVGEQQTEPFDDEYPADADNFYGLRVHSGDGEVGLVVAGREVMSVFSDGLYFDQFGGGSAGAQRITSRGDMLIPKINQTASFTFSLSESGCAVECNHATVAIVATIPPNSTVPYPVGTVLEVYRKGAAAVSIVEGAGVTIENIVGTTIVITSQYNTVSLRKNGTDTWVAAGGPYTVS